MQAFDHDNESVRILGVDTGGTFTDFVYYHSGQLTIHKVLSTPQAPEQAILQGIKDLQLDKQLDNLIIVHGSTVATNAVLERKGVKTVYIANSGLSDVLTIGRQARKKIYQLSPEPVIPPVPRSLCFEVSSRVDANGKSLRSLTDNELNNLIKFIRREQPEAVAINLLFSFLNNQDEKDIEQRLQQTFPELFISRSSDVLPEYKEYERGIATWLNAWIGPRVEGYIRRLSEGTQPAQLSIMQSSGGTIAAKKASRQAVRMLLSGPAGGLAGARFIAENKVDIEKQNTGFGRNLLTFDMGGTSTDVALIEGELQLTSEGHIGDYPVAIPMVDMHTIGAGGGSIARVDLGGALQVGPESAGASPGPACYGKGGQEATVTDANLVLGRLSADDFLGGAMQLDRKAAFSVVQRIADKLALTGEQAVEEAAMGIIRLANEHMSRALRVMSIQRGIDPGDLILMPFGGAGGLHVCALADNLQMNTAMVPVHAGVLSAFGMVIAPHSRELSHTINEILTNDSANKITGQLERLARKGTQALLNEGLKDEQIHIRFSVDLRYRGQSYTLNVPWTNVRKTSLSFHNLHKKRYGHSHQQAVELVNVRVNVSASPIPLILPEINSINSTVISKRRLYGIDQAVPVHARETLGSGQQLIGPALITERVSTTFLAPDWTCEVDKTGNLRLNRIRKHSLTRDE